MGERADELRARDTYRVSGTEADRTEAYAEYAEVNTASSDVTDSDDPEEIREQIEETRADLSETIDAIQEKLSPQNITAQAKDAVREATVGKVEQAVSSATDSVRETFSSASDSTREAGFSVVQVVKRNPIPAAMAGIGLGWLWMNRKNVHVRDVQHVGSTYTPAGYRGGQRYSGQQFQGQSGRYNEGDYARRSGGMYAGGQYPTGQYAGQYGGTQYSGREFDSESEQGRIGQMTSQVGEKAGQVGEQVGQVAGQVQEQVGEYAEQAQYQMYQARSMIQEKYQSNPLALAIVALGAGVLTGLAVPETETEEQFFGETRDAFVDRAQTMAQDTMDKVQTVMSEAKDAATEAVKESAQQEGLSG